MTRNFAVHRNGVRYEIDPRTPWRDHLDAALDAMMVGRKEEAEAMFDALDILYKMQEPFGSGWQLEVRYRDNRNVVRGRVKGTNPTRWHVHKFTPERRTKHVIATMLYLANLEHFVADGALDPAARACSMISKAFGVTYATMRQWIADGSRDLKIVPTEHPFALIMIEDDVAPAEERLEIRRANHIRRSSL